MSSHGQGYKRSAENLSEKLSDALRRESALRAKCSTLEAYVEARDESIRQLEDERDKARAALEYLALWIETRHRKES